ncbi:EF hand associated, type-1 [Corchorus capsularis]|uniref:EF hand associated, type-1 n=1 Tax=Corchorus capsularis TaxID=210143 RepID=A0A1R3GLL7_COCAP|nr:EF hand associated, type-1 [Corchorus capsularis]
MEWQKRIVGHGDKSLLNDQACHKSDRQCASQMRRNFGACCHGKIVDWNDFCKNWNSSIPDEKIYEQSLLLEPKYPRGGSNRNRLSCSGSIRVSHRVVEKREFEQDRNCFVKKQIRTVENLIYIGYPNDPLSATRVTRRRSVDRKKKQSGRNVFQCFVFAPRRSGKSALINSFLGKPFSDSYFPTTDEKYDVNFVEHLGGIKKTLVLREIPEDGVSKVLFRKDSLAACDIAIFVYDSSDESSWKTTAELLKDVAGYEIPCLIVALKSDLDQIPMLIEDSTRVIRYMGIEEPIEISSKLGDFNDIFRRIVNAAQNPHLSILETEDERSRKENRLRKRSLMVVSIGAAAVAIVGLVTYCAWMGAKWIGCF